MGPKAVRLGPTALRVSRLMAALCAGSASRNWGPFLSPGQGVHWAGAKEMLAPLAAQSPEWESC